MNTRRWLAILASLLLTTTTIGAQVANDECTGAIYLGPLTTYCSAVGEFSNEGATTSPEGKPFCQPDDGQRDVWVSFQATAASASIRVIGSLLRDGGGSLVTPQFTLYRGIGCESLEEVQCISDGFGSNVVQVLAPDLLAGEIYYLRLSARGGMTGTFKLCIDLYDFVPEPAGDCVNGVLLCSKDPFTVPRLEGAGRDANEVARQSCLRRESNSVWYKWTCDESGDLGFVLTPSNPVDDLDFIVYELPNGVDDCAAKVQLRCEAAGENIVAPLSDWERCSGETGLRAGEPDESEPPGCQPSNNNFVSTINMVAGRSYALMVNNFSESGNGFSITWSGAGTFVGPKPAFAVSPGFGGQCDLTEFRFTNQSSTTPGATNTYQWFFGSFGDPGQMTGEGPHEVSYGSFGEKLISLRLRSSDGCVVTETKRIYVEPCCLPEDPLVAGVPLPVDPLCAGTPSGSFELPILSGARDYFYSLNGGPYLPDGTRTGLSAGTYDVFVENIKGCRDTAEVTLVDPEPLSVDVGDDRTLSFGDSLLLEVLPNQAGTYEFTWTGADSVRCVTDDCSQVYVYGFRPAELSVNALSSAGCTAVDRLQIEVRKERPLYAPTAFSPDGDEVNDLWTLFGPPVLTRINYLRIFDRWGNQVYEGVDLAPNDLKSGWDGNFRDEEMNTGVYAWVAEVEYVDGEAIVVEGDLNLFR